MITGQSVFFLYWLFRSFFHVHHLRASLKVRHRKSTPPRCERRSMKGTRNSKKPFRTKTPRL